VTVWDAGCGFAQISLEQADQGHRVTLCDLSKKMLARSRQQFGSKGLKAEFHHQSAQKLSSSLPQFDLVLCHALLEWLAEPLLTLKTISGRVKPGGAFA